MNYVSPGVYHGSFESIQPLPPGAIDLIYNQQPVSSPLGYLDSTNYNGPEPTIKELVEQTLRGFIGGRNTEQTRFAMEASLVQLYRELERRGVIRDAVNSGLVKLTVADVRKFTRYDIALGKS